MEYQYIKYQRSVWFRAFSVYLFMEFDSYQVQILKCHFLVSVVVPCLITCYQCDSDLLPGRRSTWPCETYLAIIIFLYFLPRVYCIYKRKAGFNLWIAVQRRICLLRWRRTEDAHFLNEFFLRFFFWCALSRTFCEITSMFVSLPIYFQVYIYKNYCGFVCRSSCTVSAHWNSLLRVKLCFVPYLGHNNQVLELTHSQGQWLWILHGF